MAFVKAAREAAPEIQEDWKWIWRAWHRLHLDRPWVSGGMGPANPRRIPWLVVRQWANWYGYTREEADFMDACILVMDSEYLQHHDEVIKRELENKS